MLERATKLAPTNALLFASLAICQEQLNRVPDAIELIEHAVALDPGNLDIRIQAAGLFSRIGRTDDAARHVAFLQKHLPTDHPLRARPPFDIVVD